MTESVPSASILFVAELIKMVIATGFITVDTEPSDAPGTGVNKLIWLIRNSSKMFVLAGIYALMNILSFVSLEYIGAGEFTICAQLKILTVSMQCIDALIPLLLLTANLHTHVDGEFLSVHFGHLAHGDQVAGAFPPRYGMRSRCFSQFQWRQQDLRLFSYFLWLCCRCVSDSHIVDCLTPTPSCVL